MKRRKKRFTDVGEFQGEIIIIIIMRQKGGDDQVER